MAMNIEKQKRAPIYEALEAFQRKRVVPFDVPGHKRGRGNPELVKLLGEKCVGLDVNSMKPLDNLCHPVSVIRQAEDLAADAFGAENAFLMVGGTTSAVQSMILSVCKAGDKLILPRNVHKSAINALVLCGAVPVYVNPEVNSTLGISLGMELSQVEKEDKLGERCPQAVLAALPQYDPAELEETWQELRALQDQGLTQEDINMVMKVFDGQQPSDIISRADAFIRTGKSPEETARIAYYMYNYYRNSKIMGYDEVAVYIADTYFINGGYTVPDEEKMLEMKLFAESNRRSLIGMQAPELTLQDPSGTMVDIRPGDQDYTVLYFYDDECPGCIRTTPALMQYMIRSSAGINFSVYMIYTQDDRDRWMGYIQRAVAPFSLPANVRVTHLWDPDMTSGFVTKYGVVTTPKLFLLDRNGVIIGRDLTPTALGQVVEVQESQLNPTEMIFEQIFSPLANTADTTLITKEIDTFFQDSKDNPEFFHELFYTLYQYLKTNSSYPLQQGAAYLANKYIASMPELWETVTFTDKGETSGSVIRADFKSPQDFIDQTALAVLMFYRNPLDKPVTDLELRTPKNKKMRIYDVPEAEYTVLYFYSMDCALCNAVTEELGKMYRQYSPSEVQFIAVYTGRDRSWKKYIKENAPGWINLWDQKRTSGMFDKYDLMDVPAIYLLDSEKKTVAKDINPDVLGALLEYFLEPEATEE